ncbi:MAG: GlxA family transcriptional regulator, partial [Mesorhizobium sp.]
MTSNPANRKRDRAQPAAGEAPLAFAVLVFPGFPMMAFSSLIEPLRAANVLAKRECYRWVIVGADPGTVEASNGVV